MDPYSEQIQHVQTVAAKLDIILSTLYEGRECATSSQDHTPALASLAGAAAVTSNTQDTPQPAQGVEGNDRGCSHQSPGKTDIANALIAHLETIKTDISTFATSIRSLRNGFRAVQSHNDKLEDQQQQLSLQLADVAAREKELSRSEAECKEKIEAAEATLKTRHQVQIAMEALVKAHEDEAAQWRNKINGLGWVQSLNHRGAAALSQQQSQPTSGKRGRVASLAGSSLEEIPSSKCVKREPLSPWEPLSPFSNASTSSRHLSPEIDRQQAGTLHGSGQPKTQFGQASQAPQPPIRSSQVMGSQSGSQLHDPVTLQHKLAEPSDAPLHIPSEIQDIWAQLNVHETIGYADRKELVSLLLRASQRSIADRPEPLLSRCARGTAARTPICFTSLLRKVQADFFRATRINIGNIVCGKCQQDRACFRVSWAHPQAMTDTTLPKRWIIEKRTPPAWFFAAHKLVGHNA
ncbi:MAG: hypothetical protein L6R39_004538 [Caloplaca ligustica]|nr:MAG: hypothetical protein L6R39_004538 [Caloplaca ligustica]